MASGYQGYNNNNIHNDNPYIPKAKPYNPFTDPRNEQRFNKTIDECNRIKGIKTQPNHQNNIAMNTSNNPYLNDANLTAAMAQFSPLKNTQYLQRHSVQRNGDYNNNNYNNYYNNYNNNNYNNNNYNAKAQQSITSFATEETKETRETKTINGKRIMIAPDNPYHPTNFYKDNEAESEEQKKAKNLVNKYRVNEIKRDAVENEYAQFISSLPDMAMINEVNDEEVKNQNSNGYQSYNKYNKYQKHRYKYNEFRSPTSSIASNGSNGSNGSIKIGVDDMIPGQIAINASNFHKLRVNDTVWIRNDDGDWEIYNIIKMEKTRIDKSSFTFIATFKNGDKQKIIWQQQCCDFVMAKFKKEDKNYNNNMYVLNNIFKINGNGINGVFVLKGYNPTNGMANVKDVSTGNMLNVNLNHVQHTII